MKIFKRRILDRGIEYDRLYFYCPACNEPHGYNVNVPAGSEGAYGRIPSWSYNGSEDSPTFTPSLRMYTIHPETKVERTLCHLFVTDGNIAYCTDCPHEYAGKTVPMQEIPERILNWF